MVEVAPPALENAGVRADAPGMHWTPVYVAVGLLAALQLGFAAVLAAALL